MGACLFMLYECECECWACVSAYELEYVGAGWQYKRQNTMVFN